MANTFNTAQFTPKSIDGTVLADDIILGGGLKLTTNLSNSIGNYVTTININDGIKLGTTGGTNITSTGNVTITSDGKIGLRISPLRPIDNNYDVTIHGNTYLNGNLDISGSLNYTSSEIIQVTDNTLLLNSNYTGIPVENAGLEVKRGNYTNSALLWNETSNHWEISNPVDNTSAVTSYRIMDENYSDGKYMAIGNKSFGDTVNIISVSGQGLQLKKIGGGTNYISFLSDKVSSGTYVRKGYIGISTDDTTLTLASDTSSADIKLLNNTVINGNITLSGNVSLSGINATVDGVDISVHAASATAHHDNSNDPTVTQKSALAGTDGTPSDANRYVTNSDTRLLHPDATSSTKGWVQIGTGVDIKNGTISVKYGADVGTSCAGNDDRLSNARQPSAHSLIDTNNHIVSALTVGQYIRSNSATTYDFSAIINGDLPSSFTGKTYNGLTLVTNVDGFSISGGTANSRSLTIQDADKKFAGTGTGLTLSGAYDLSFVMTAVTSLTLPTSGTVTALGNAKTGSNNIVLSTSPTLVTPILGSASATSINKVTITAPTTSATLTISNSKTLAVSKSITLTASTDGKTLNINNGGTLGSAAFTDSTSYESVISLGDANQLYGMNNTGTAKEWKTLNTTTSGATFNFALTTPTVITLNIPMASIASVSAGLLSNIDYTTFNTKENALTFSNGLTRNINVITPTYGTSVNTVCSGNDSRLSDKRTPSNHNLIDTTMHAVSGLTIGNVIIATSATDYAFGQLAHSNLSGISANQHHNQIHDINGSDHNGTLSSTKGGTGLSTYAIGDMIYCPVINTLSKLSAGTDGQVLQMVNGIPSWCRNVSYTAGDGITLTGTAFNHADTSSITNLPTMARQYVNGLTFDTYGHVTGCTTGTETVADTNTVTTITASTNITVTDTGTSGDHIYAIAHTGTSNQASVSNTGRSYIQSIILDTDGHVTGLSSATETITDTNTASAVDDILDGSNSGTAIKYSPYTSQQTYMSFDTSITTPVKTDRLNLNGSLYATNLYVGTSPVLTSLSGQSQDFGKVGVYNTSLTGTVTASTIQDTFNLKAGNNITLSVSSKDITINSSYTDTNTATAADNILHGSNSGTAITYSPYTTQGAGHFDSSITSPTHTNRLNYDGYLYATKVFNNGGHEYYGPDNVPPYPACPADKYLTGVSGSGNGTVTFTVANSSNPTWDSTHTHSNDHAPSSDNQNLFSHIHAYSVGTTNVSNSPYTVTSQADHIQFLAGTNVSLAMSTTGIITINSTYTDTNTWIANTLNTAGYVASPSSSNANQVWKCDASGNPAWRADADTNTTYTVFAKTTNGLVPAPGGTLTTRFLREDGTWVIPTDTNTNTTYSAGDGLVLNSTTFSVGCGDGLEFDTSSPKKVRVQLQTGTANTVGTVSRTSNGIGVNLGSTSTTACAGSDSRLSDSRVPNSHGDDKHNCYKYARIAFAVGQSQAIWTHNAGWSSYIVQITSNSPESHYYYTNNTSNSVTICLDDAAYNAITLDIVLTNANTIATSGFTLS